jgi:hypothetical protein
VIGVVPLVVRVEVAVVIVDGVAVVIRVGVYKLVVGALVAVVVRGVVLSREVPATSSSMVIPGSSAELAVLALCLATLNRIGRGASLSSASHWSSDSLGTNSAKSMKVKLPTASGVPGVRGTSSSSSSVDTTTAVSPLTRHGWLAFRGDLRKGGDGLGT